MLRVFRAKLFRWKFALDCHPAIRAGGVAFLSRADEDFQSRAVKKMAERAARGEPPGATAELSAV
jgi:hypothetical protein